MPMSDSGPTRARHSWLTHAHATWLRMFAGGEEAVPAVQHDHVAVGPAADLHVRTLRRPPLNRISRAASPMYICKLPYKLTMQS